MIIVAAFDALVELDKEIATYNEDLSNASSMWKSLTAKIKDLGEQLATEDINTARANNAQTLTISIITVLGCACSFHPAGCHPFTTTNPPHHLFDQYCTGNFSRQI